MHTPGPWDMYETGSWPETNHFHGIYSNNHPTGRIALVEGFDVAASNARLIAAAPELLVAPKLYVDHFGDPLKVARAAISKAEAQ